MFKTSKEYVKEIIGSAVRILHGKINVSNVCEIISSFTLIRRIDCLLEPYYTNIRKTYEEKKDIVDSTVLDDILKRISISTRFYNTIGMGLTDSIASYHDLAYALDRYVSHFCPEIRNVLIRFHFKENVNLLLYTDVNLLTNLVNCLLTADLADHIDSLDIVEALTNLHRSVNHSHNNSTPELYSRLLRCVLFGKEVVSDNISIYDPTCGTGYLLRDVALDAARYHNAKISIFGQDIVESNCALVALCNILTGESPDNIKAGDILTDDKFSGKRFQYCISHMPFGIQWNDDDLRILSDKRFSIGIPNRTDAQMLFIQDLISKMDPNGARAAFISSNAPLIENRSGENSIRRWLINHDYVESIIALPKARGIATNIPLFLWVLTNKKKETSKGRIHFFDLPGFMQENCLEETSIKEFCDFVTNNYNKSNESPFNKIVEYSKLQLFNVLITKKEGKKVRKEKMLVSNDTDLTSVLGTLKCGLLNITEVYLFQFSKIFSYFKPYRPSHEVRTSVMSSLNDAMKSMKEIMEMKPVNTSLHNKHVQDDWYVNVPKTWDEVSLHVTVNIYPGASIPLSKQQLDGKQSNSAIAILNLDYLRGRIDKPQFYVESNDNMTLSESGDTLIIMKGANAGEVLKGRDGVVGSTMAKLSPNGKDIDPDFLFYLMYAMRNRLQGISKNNRGRRSLSVIDLANLCIFLPDLEEQKRICAYLKDFFNNINMLTGESHIKIPVLEEYRQSLIYDLVTGKCTL